MAGVVFYVDRVVSTHYQQLTRNEILKACEVCFYYCSLHWKVDILQSTAKFEPISRARLEMN